MLHSPKLAMQNALPCNVGLAAAVTDAAGNTVAPGVSAVHMATLIPQARFTTALMFMPC